MSKSAPAKNRSIFLFIFIGLFVFLISFSYKSYNSYINRAEEQLLDELYALANTSSLLIDPELHERVTNTYLGKDDITDSEQDSSYHSLHLVLKDIASSNNLQSAVYTFVKSEEDDDYEFIATSSDRPYFRHKYGKSPAYLMDNFEKGGKIKCYQTSTGLWASAFAPIINHENEVLGVVQVDKNFDSFITAANREFMEDLGISVLIFGFVAFWLIYLVKRFTKKIEEAQLALSASNQNLREEIEIRKETEEKLKLSNSKIRKKAKHDVGLLEQRFSKIFNYSNDGIFILDPKNDKILDVNPAACKLLEYDHDELVTKKMSEVHPHEIKPLNEFCEMIFSDGGGWTDELSCYTKTGKYIPAEISASHFSDGKSDYMVAMVRDVSLRIKTRKQLEQLNGQLEKRVKDRTKQLTSTNVELNRTLKELKKTNNELDHFLYKVTHDFRAPLLSILGLINLAKKEDRHRGDISDKYFELIEGSITKLDKLNGEITNLVKSQRTGINISDITFGELVYAELETLKFLVNKRDVKWTVKINEEIPFSSDEFRIKMILHNVLYNAIKYSDVDKEQSFVEIDIRTTRDDCVLLVTDNGIGISSDLQSRIFDMFFRATENSTGSGLGLYMVKETVNKLLGTIEVESEFGTGTTFKIIIPNLFKKEAHSKEKKRTADWVDAEVTNS